MLKRTFLPKSIFSMRQPKRVSNQTTLPILFSITLFGVVTSMVITYFFLSVNLDENHAKVLDEEGRNLEIDNSVWEKIAENKGEFKGKIKGENKFVEISNFVDPNQLHGKLKEYYEMEERAVRAREIGDQSLAKYMLGGFNKGLSDITSSNRVVPDSRSEVCRARTYNEHVLPKAAVIMVFCNEITSILLRSVNSVLNYSPPNLLDEIILVADKCADDDVMLREETKIKEHIRFLPKTRYIAAPKRLGIVGSRLLGIEASKAEAFVILDSHIEATHGWLEPLMATIYEFPNATVIPRINGIDAETLELTQGGIGCTLGLIWNLMEHGIIRDKDIASNLNMKITSGAVTTPTMSGGLFAARKQNFYDLGSYDTGLSFWGAENLELSFRVWQCGGYIMCHPCSVVHHMFRSGGGGRSYHVGNQAYMINKLRIMDVWMDDYADITWNFINKPMGVNYGDVSDRRKFRENNKCQSFEWYLENIWPESEITHIKEDLPNLGKISSPDSEICIQHIHISNFFFRVDLAICERITSEFFYFAKSKQIRPTANSESCLTYTPPKPIHIDVCTEYSMNPNQRWYYKDKLLINEGSNNCIERSETGTLILNICDPDNINQTWNWGEFVPKLEWKNKQFG